MQVVSAEWQEMHRQHILGESFIEVYLDLFDAEATKDVSASDEGSVYFADTSQVVELVSERVNPYLTLEQNLWVLDGFGELLPSIDYGRTGYVGDELSGSDGSFVVPPTINLNFTRVHTRLIPGITIEWDEAHGDFAVDFRVTAYEGETIKVVEEYTGNTDVSRNVVIDISDYDRIQIEVLKWSSPYRRARIASIKIGMTLKHDKSSIMRFEHQQQVDPLSATLPKAAVKFSLDNSSREFDPFNREGLSKYLTERQRVRTRYGYDVGGATEWIHGGVFYLSEWDAPQNGTMVNFEARDVFEFLMDIYQEGMYRPSGVSFYELATEVLEGADLPVDERGNVRWEIHSSLKDKWTTAPLPIASRAECLQMIANATGCVLHCDRQGVLRIEPIAAFVQTAFYLAGVKVGGEPNALEFQSGSTFFLPMALDVQSYRVDDFVSYKRPEVSLTKPLAQVNVSRYAYQPSGESKVIYEANFPVEGNTTLFVKYPHPSVNVNVIVTGDIEHSVKSYTNGCEISLTADGLVGITIEGEELIKSESVIVLPTGSRGETRELKNPLVTDFQMAQQLAGEVLNYLVNRRMLDLEWRADPRLDALDIISLQTKFGTSPVEMIDFSISYTGAFRGKGRGRDIGVLAQSRNR